MATILLRADIIKEAESWIGTRWQHQASCKGVATDCIGFIAGVAANCGSEEAQLYLRTLEWRRYPRNPIQELLFEMSDKLMDRIQPYQAKMADVLMFHYENLPTHFGFIGPDGTLIHAWAQMRKVVKHQLDADWRSRIVRAYSLRGIE